MQDVEKSAAWYKSLLNCQNNHGGSTFDMLTDNEGEVFLCLHKWGEHEHPTLTSPKVEAGNGLILYLKVEDLQSAWENAQALNATIEEPPHVNPNSGKEQFCIRDLDRYYLMITL